MKVKKHKVKAVVMKYIKKEKIGSTGMNEDIDELDNYLRKQVESTEAESLKIEHVIREKVTVNP